MSNRWPAVVTSVDRERREVRVEIPGITDGADEMPIADIEYPIGDRSAQTEIRILPGDNVWVAFHGGDPRYPIITGFRVKQAGNEVGTRRWVHDNFELTADGEYKLTAGNKVTIIVGNTTLVLEQSKATLTSSTMEFHGYSKFFGNVDCTETITAVVDVKGGDVSLKKHLTSNVQSGTGTSGTPIPE